MVTQQQKAPNPTPPKTVLVIVFGRSEDLETLKELREQQLRLGTKPDEIIESDQILFLADQIHQDLEPYTLLLRIKNYPYDWLPSYFKNLPYRVEFNDPT